MSLQAASVDVVTYNTGEVIQLGGGIVLRILEDGSHTDNRLGAVHTTIPPHTPGPPQHLHQMHDETFLILSGSVRFTTGTTAYDTRTGDYIIVPPLAPHTFANETAEEATMYSTFTPAFYINYFRLLQEMVAKNGGKLRKEDGLEAMGRYATLQTEMMAAKEV
ncbi:hypothetical protein MMC30_003143 [Trapelia coarctata]|nr:hypothetical protein [Trapelia coarctata]